MQLGHRPITTLDNADELVTAAEQAFDLLLPAVLSTCNWRFAITISQLALSPMVPPPQTNWQNIYLLPSGWLKNIRIIPQNYVYEIYTGNQIWCNWGTATPIYMEYAFQPDVSLLPASFVQYFIYEIAAFLGLASAQKPEYYAVLEQKRIMALAVAAAADAQNRPQASQVDIPVLNKRYVTGVTNNVIA